MSTFIGRHVRLRRPESSDVPAVLRYLAHPDLVGRRNLTAEIDEVLPLGTGDVEALFAAWRKSRREPTLLVVRREDEEVIGHATMGWDWDPLAPWVSVTIEPEQWRRGYGSDALDMMLAHLFGWLPAHSVSCWVPEWSAEGLAFAAAHGFRECGRVRRAGLRAGKEWAYVSLDLLRPEWRGSREREAADAARG